MAGEYRRWRLEDAVDGHGSVALDVSRRHRAGPGLRRTGARRARIAALSRRTRTSCRSAHGTGEGTGLAQRSRAGCKDLRSPAGGLLPIVWVGILLSVFQQFVGINVIFYYSSTLWHSVGFSEADSFSITVVTSVVNVLVTLVAIALVDKIGRKPLLLIGSAGMTITLGAMAWCFSQATGSGANLVLPAPWGMVALVAANAYVVCFGLSWGPMVWVLLGEMFPNSIRAIALAVAAAAQWLANFAITISFPALAEIGLSFAYGLYAAFALISLIFVIKTVRETKG